MIIAMILLVKKIGQMNMFSQLSAPQNDRRKLMIKISQANKSRTGAANMSSFKGSLSSRFAGGITVSEVL